MSEIINIDFIKFVLDEKYWDYDLPRGHYSHHSSRRRIDSTDTGCGNCDGAGCDYCEWIINPGHFEFSIDCGKLEEILKLEFNLPDCLVSDLVYGEKYSYKFGNDRYYLHMPTQRDLEDKYPEFLSSINFDDEKVFNLCKEAEEIASPKCFNDVRNYVKHKLSNSGLDSHHIDNQLTRYWATTESGQYATKPD